jgi:hypothetical protein
MQHLLARIQSRTEEVGDCWEWQGALQAYSRVPVMSHKGKHQCVRRWVAQAVGHDVEGKVVTYRCGNNLCVNPEHLQLMTKSALHQRVSRQQVHKINMANRIRIAEARRANAKLTPEQVQAIRDDPRLQREIAKDYGITQPTVSSIKRGEIWRDYTNPFIQLIK